MRVCIVLHTRRPDRLEQIVGLFSKLRRNRDDEPVDLDERSPQLGIKYRDLILLNEITSRATDTSQPRRVVFYLYAGSEDVGQVMAGEARLQGFDVDVREPKPAFPDQWAVVCATHGVLTPDFVRESVDFFEALAQRHGAEYDGWEAAVA